MKRKKKKLPVVSTTRSCGDCFACCYVFTIDALDKPAGLDCRYLDRSHELRHCTQYAQRPVDCSSYQCAWRMEDGFGEDVHRPDKIGVVFTPHFNRREIESVVGPFTLTAYETRPSAFTEGPAADFMMWLAQRFIVVSFTGPRLNKARVMGPEDRVNAALAWCAQNGRTKITDIMKVSDNESFFQKVF